MSAIDTEEEQEIFVAFTASQENYVRRVGLSIVAIGVVFYALYFGLDWYVYPESIAELAIIRAFVLVVLIAGLIAMSFIPGNWLAIGGIVLSWSASFSIVYMTYILGGAASPYYAGIILVFIFFASALPWHYKNNLVTVGPTVALYSLSSYYYSTVHTIPADYWTSFVSNVVLLSSIGVMCTYSSYVQYKQRWENFQLQFQLKKKNREALDLNRSKTEFFSNMSHELRTPLTLILGPLQDLLSAEEKLPEQVDSLLNTAQNNGLRLLRLVNDLLKVMRLEEGEGLASEAIAVGPILQELVDSLRYAAESKSIVLSSSCDIDEILVDGDHGAVEKILMNILSNALKFTPEGGSISLECKKSEETIEISISDTGIGISAEDLPHIFERFQQADSSTTRGYTGTGIGLSLVRELATSMGGETSAESIIGQGTTIRVCLPLWRGAAAAELYPAKVADSLETLHTAAQLAAFDAEETSVADELPYNEELATVLIVDDEPAMRKYLSDILSGVYNVIRAVDGEEGLDLARSRNPELILLDLMIPKVDGLEVCRRLKKEEQQRSKIVLLTARVDEQAKLAALENGADDFLTKPFGALELKTRLENLLLSAQLERKLSSQNTYLSTALGELKQTQSQLIHSEKLNALGSLSAGLLHEINNPLNYSLTALHLIGLEPAYQDDSDFAELVDDASEGMERIRVIVSDLRAFAYPSESDKKANFPLLKAVESSLRFTAGELANIKMCNDICESSVVLGSQSHIVQVLVNLIINATKAIHARESTEPGEIRIAASESRGRLVVKVVDNGVGLTEEVRAQVFDPFFTTRKVGEGVGLGLSVCHTIIQNHGGKLAVESDVGKGATFIFDLEMAQ